MIAQLPYQQRAQQKIMSSNSIADGGTIAATYGKRTDVYARARTMCVALKALARVSVTLLVNVSNIDSSARGRPLANPW